MKCYLLRILRLNGMTEIRRNRIATGVCEIRETQHGAFEIFRQGVLTGFISMNKSDREKLIKQKK